MPEENTGSYVCLLPHWTFLIFSSAMFNALCMCTWHWVVSYEEVLAVGTASRITVVRNNTINNQFKLKLLCESFFFCSTCQCLRIYYDSCCASRSNPFKVTTTLIGRKFLAMSMIITITPAASYYPSVPAPESFALMTDHVMFLVLLIRASFSHKLPALVLVYTGKKVLLYTNKIILLK